MPKARPGRRQTSLRPVLVAALLVSIVSAGTALSEPIGSQVRISRAGPNGDRDFGAANSAVAYSPRTNRYLVVWEADDSTDGEFEIFGRLVTATGRPAGREFRISDMGPGGNPGFGAQNPAVAYNAQANEFLVVWAGDDNVAPLVADETEVFGQRLSAAGRPVGANDFRISNMGPDGNAAFDAAVPTVAYSAQANRYLVAWQGDNATDEENEIYGELLSATGVPAGPNDFRISDMGPDGVATFNALDPASAHDSKSNEFMVIWKGDDNTGTLVDNDFEVFGQRINASGGEAGPNDFRVSDMGPEGSGSFAVLNPAIAYASQPDEFLVVWRADDNTPPLVDNEAEVFGQRVSAAGVEVGANDFRISQMGPDGNPNVGGFRPSTAYSPTANEYLVVWYGDDVAPPLADEEFEIYGQRLNAAGAPVGADDFRLSLMGPDGDPDFDSAAPDLAYGSRPNQYLVSWQGEDNARPLVDDEFEIFARRASAGTGRLDKRKPRVRLRFRRAQRLARQRAVIVSITCNERVSLSGTAQAGSRRSRLRRAVDPGRRTRLRFRLSGAARRARTVRVTIRVTDTAGNSTSKKVRIRGG